MERIKQGSAELKKFKKIKDIFLYTSTFDIVFMNFCKKRRKWNLIKDSHVLFWFSLLQYCLDILINYK